MALLALVPMSEGTSIEISESMRKANVRSLSVVKRRMIRFTLPYKCGEKTNKLRMESTEYYFERILK